MKVQRLGEILREIREAKEMTQYATAVRAGMTQATLKRIEEDDRDPAFSSMRKICASLGVSIDEISRRMAPVELAQVEDGPGRPPGSGK